MGKVLSRLNKQYYRFNAENRAHREIEREKPTPAPRHPSSVIAMKQILEETQHIKEEAKMKDPALDEFLKKVYVKSHGTIEEIKKKPSERSQLPLSRARPEENELGYFEPQTIPKGKFTLLQVMKFLADNQGDPKLFDASKISSDYELSREDVDDVLSYFSTFHININEEMPPLVESQKKVLKRFASSGKPTLISDKSETTTSKADS